MALTLPAFVTNIISTIGTTVTDRAITTQAFKDKFDETGVAIKAYLVSLCGEVDAALLLKSDKNLTFATVTASKTFALGDADVVQVCDHATVAINLTIPPHTAVAYPVGAFLPARWQGVAQVAFVAGAGVTINPATKLKINATGDYVGAVQRSQDVWDLIGPTKA